MVWTHQRSLQSVCTAGVILSGCVAALAAAGTGLFGLTGSMAQHRYGHTATSLLNGEVLVAGGATNGPAALATAELYRPFGGTFVATGSMTVGRYAPSATLLANGTVLIVGGLGEDVLASAEIYNPGAGAFAATGSMATTRFQHTATLLSDGKVLIAGGYSFGGEQRSAEIYDPASGRFTPTGLMTTGRKVHSAVRLANGKVLIVGGSCCTGVPIDKAELYDPADGTFTATGRMTVPRFGPTATLLSDGRVLVAGGYNNGNAQATAEIYDPATGTFMPTGSMTIGRYYHSAEKLPDGTVLVIGGYRYDGGTFLGPLSSAERYDPVSGTFLVPYATMTTPRVEFASASLQDGSVIVVGGDPAGQSWGTGGTGLSTAEIFYAVNADDDSASARLTGGNTFVGNQTVQGAVEATSFGGDGSRLTNVSAVFATSAERATFANFASHAEGANTATTAALAFDAMALGGVSAASYARVDTPNSFTGNQSINGNTRVMGSVDATAVIIGGGTPIVRHLSVTVQVTIPPLKPSQCANYSFTVAGATDGDTIALGVPSAMMNPLIGNRQFDAWVNAPNSVNIRACNLDPNLQQKNSMTGTIRIDIWKH